ncbi:MAG: protease pro-enzyme activation domain-containing protein, partial [Thermoplasmata archaeon]
MRPSLAATFAHRLRRPLALSSFRSPGLVLGVLAVLVASTVAGGAFGVPVTPSRSPSGLSSVSAGVVAASGPWVPVPDAEPGSHVSGAVDLGAAGSLSLPVVVTLTEDHPGRLAQVLRALSTPGSPSYHHYMTASEFDAQFGGSPSAYSSLVAYFHSGGVSRLATYADRLTITFDASPSQILRLFHVPVDRFELGDRRYVAPVGSPRLPQSLAGSVAG